MAIALVYFLWRPASFLPVTPYANDLHLAVNNNDLNLVRSLLDSGYDPNSFTPAGRSILTEAVVRGNYQVVELLLSRGARLPGTAAGHAPILVKARPVAAAHVPVAAHAPVAAHTPVAAHAAPVQVAPVKTAAPAANAPAAPGLAEASAVQPPDPIPATGYTDSADGLIARQDGQLALAADPAHDLVSAIAGGSVPDVAAVSTALGPPPGLPVVPILPMVGLSDNPILAAVEANRQEILKLLLMYGPLPTVTFADGDSALMRAIRNEYDGIVELLLRAVDDLAYRNDMGQDALMVAAGQGYLFGVQQLLSRGAPVVGHDRRGDTALSLAVRGGYLEVVRALLESGALAQNEISAAVAAYDRNMIQLLLDYDARLGLQDGQALMGQAQALGDTDFAAYLARHGVRR